MADVWMRNATPENAISLMSRLIADPVRWIDAVPAATRSLCSGALARAQLQAGDARQALVSADAATAQERDRIRAVACGKLRDREGMASALKALEDDCPTPFAVEVASRPSAPRYRPLGARA
ncbi:MAG: hypothetical protein H7255_18510 [Ramlibacter sp.]|nr:hypothetical protein [Ramlibacter sp.]